MAGNLLRFRCYQCDKLLGISATKVGRTIACPNCKAELIVPDPNEPQVDEPVPAIAPIVEEPTRLREPAAPPVHEPGFSWEEIDESLLKLSRSEPKPEPIVESGPRVAAVLPIDPKPSIDINLGLPVSPDSDAVLSEIAIEIAPVREVRSSRRQSTDVVLSQAVLASWSMFVLLALAVAFVAGMFVGHFVWKTR